MGLFLIGCGKPEHVKTEVEPASKTIRVGQSLQLKAVARDPEGEEIAETTFQWSVEGDSATINDQGLLTARTPGKVKVLAAAEKVTGTADITILRQKVATLVVTPEPSETTVGGSVQVRVTAQNASGQGLADVEVRAKTSTSGARLDRASAVTDSAGLTTFELTTADTASISLFGTVSESFRHRCWWICTNFAIIGSSNARATGACSARTTMPGAWPEPRWTVRT